MRPCESLANRPLPCESRSCFQKFQISAHDCGTGSMRSRFRACMYEFMTTVTEGVVHGVHNVVIRLSFSVFIY